MKSWVTNSAWHIKGKVDWLFVCSVRVGVISQSSLSNSFIVSILNEDFSVTYILSGVVIKGGERLRTLFSGQSLIAIKSYVQSFWAFGLRLSDGRDEWGCTWWLSQWLKVFRRTGHISPRCSDVVMSLVAEVAMEFIWIWCKVRLSHSL